MDDEHIPILVMDEATAAKLLNCARPLPPALVPLIRVAAYRVAHPGDIVIAKFDSFSDPLRDPLTGEPVA